MAAKIITAFTTLAVLVQLSVAAPHYYDEYYGSPLDFKKGGSSNSFFATAIATPEFANADASSDIFYPGYKSTYDIYEGYGKFPYYESGYKPGYEYEGYGKYPYYESGYKPGYESYDVYGKFPYYESGYKPGYEYEGYGKYPYQYSYPHYSSYKY